MVDTRARVQDDEAERRAWYEILELVRSLTPDERLAPGYWRDPDWSVRDVLGHLGTWFAQAEIQLEQIAVGTYEGHDVDIDALNAAFLEAMHDQPWEVAWLQANAGRTRMVELWSATRTMTDEAALVGPQVRHRALPRAPRSPARVGRRAAPAGAANRPAERSHDCNLDAVRAGARVACAPPACVSRANGREESR